jgi:hypothetical protein
MVQRGGAALKFPLGLIAAFACACLVLAPAASASGSATAKAKRSKSCKKKHHHAACKKRKRARSSAPAPPRTVTLTWDSWSDINLVVFDQNGHRAGFKNGSIVNGISGSTFAGDGSDGFGPETFSDPAGRRVGYLACYVSGPAANVTLTDSGQGGGTYTAVLGPTDRDHAFTASVGWGYLPIAAHC